jgi:hypothetical protein
LVQLRQERCALYRIGERAELKAGGLGTLGHEQLEWMEDDVKHLKHSTRLWSLRTSLYGPCTQNGAGVQKTAHRHWLIEVRLRNSVEWSHPPDNAKDRRERDISYRSVNGISTTSTGKSRFARAHEGASGTTAKRPWNYGCELCPRATSTGSRGLDPRVTGTSSNKETVDSQINEKEEKQ